MKVAIIGASGFVGSHLTHYLLETTSHQLVLFSHKASRLQFTKQHEKRLIHIDGNVLHAKDMTPALQDCDAAVYLVHLMGQDKTKDFAALETRAATNFATAACLNGVQRVIYVGGMGDASTTLTKHLQSRATTGDILRGQVKQLIELRTPMIVGPGGAGFEVLTMLVRRLPLMPVPRWARAITQPITVHDVVRYVTASLTLNTKMHQTIDIGGPEQLSYIQVAERYANFCGQRLITVPLPIAPKPLIKFVLRRTTNNVHAATVADMIDSAGYSTVVTSDKGRELFPTIKTEVIDKAFKV